MSTPTASHETYPGHEYSLPQLLFAAKRKLQHIALGGRIVATVNQVELGALERDLLEMLHLVRSAKNSSALISRIPPEVLSLIPDYYDESFKYDADRHLIALTHVCHGWREIFISRSSLWTRLCLTNVDKTRTYIQRSQSSPLEIEIPLPQCKIIDYALALAVPHIHRLKALSIHGGTLASSLEIFHCHVPLLERLDIRIGTDPNTVLDGALFNGDLSSLRELRLRGIVTHLPWRNLANLRVVNIQSCGPSYEITQLLDFFESAPLLHTVNLRYTMPASSDTPPERIVPLSHLRVFTIDTDTPHSILLHHLHIPIGASIVADSYFEDEDPLLLDYLQAGSTEFSYLSHITAINLQFYSADRLILLSGPSGSLRIIARSASFGSSPWGVINRQLFSTFGHPMLSATQTLVISDCEPPTSAEVEDCPIFQALSSANNLRTLILSNCHNLPFILPLDPERHPSNLVLCPDIEQLVLYIGSRSTFDVEPLIRMAKNRASRGVKLPSVALGGLGEREVFELKEYVTRVEYRVDKVIPAWDDVPGRSGGESN